MFAFDIETREGKIYFSFYDFSSGYFTQEDSAGLYVSKFGEPDYHRTFEPGFFSSDEKIILELIKYYLDDNKNRLEIYTNLLEALNEDLTLKSVRFLRPQ